MSMRSYSSKYSYLRS